MDEIALRRRLSWLLKLAELALVWERLWRQAWPLASLLVLFVAIALLDILPAGPAWLHALFLFCWVLSLVWAVRRLAFLRWPEPAAIRRRLETGSGLAHRPLGMLADRLGAGRDDPVAQTLWQMQRQRCQEQLQRLKLPRPAPGLAALDPIGLRFAPWLLLAIGLAGGWQDLPARLHRAIEPRLGALMGPPALLQVWITPPSYTGLAPIMLPVPPTGTPIAIPQGSGIMAELQGGYGQARLRIDSQTQLFTRQDPESQKFEGQITQGSELAIRQGPLTVARWPIAIIIDHPPNIAFAQPPDADADGRLRLDLAYQDDYGIVKAWAQIRRIDTPDAPPFHLPLTLGQGKEGRQAAWYDLTSYPWAGLPVTIEPVAEDGAGQKGQGESAAITLPERLFHHPVAAAIIHQRHLLVVDPGQSAAVADALADIAAQPQAFGGNFGVFLALVSAPARLRQEISPEGIPSVLDMLWQAALQIEDGGRPAAQKALDEAIRALEQALDGKASEGEIEERINQLQMAIGQYLQTLNPSGSPETSPQDESFNSITGEDLLNAMLRLRDLSQIGAREAARELLQQLQQTLDSLRAGGPQVLSSEQQRQARQALSDLQKLTDEQRSLLDETFRRSQTESEALGLPPGKAAQDQKAAQNQSAKQEGLRKRLGQLMQTLGELGRDIPNGLGQAEQAMRDAVHALERADSQQAIDRQSEALSRLQEGTRQAARALARQMGNGAGKDRDPLGRPLGAGPIEDGQVKIPNQADTQKARETLEELRKRAGQGQRPAEERDYLQRLLKQF